MNVARLRLFGIAAVVVAAVAATLILTGTTPGRNGSATSTALPQTMDGPPATDAAFTDPADPLASATDPLFTDANARDTVCDPENSLRAAPVSAATTYRVLNTYDISRRDAASYTIDHRIPVELGGTNDLNNLWPQLNSGGEVEVKNAIELELHNQVCAGLVTLSAAQSAIAQDWPNAVGLAAAATIGR